MEDSGHVKGTLNGFRGRVRWYLEVQWQRICNELGFKRNKNKASHRFSTKHLNQESIENLFYVCQFYVQSGMNQ